METISGWCYGRPRVDEKELSPQQYHDYFDYGPFVISFSMANSILKSNADGNLEECVPCDQLIPALFTEIKDAVAGGELDGAIGAEFKNCCSDDLLCWIWEPLVKDDDGNEIEILDLTPETRLYILDKMLDGYHSVYYEGEKE